MCTIAWPVTLEPGVLAICCLAMPEPPFLDFLPGVQVAVLLAPVAFATHIDSIPLVTLAQLNTDEVSRRLPTPVVLAAS
jgi:hypothetical protein